MTDMPPIFYTVMGIIALVGGFIMLDMMRDMALDRQAHLGWSFAVAGVLGFGAWLIYAAVDMIRGRIAIESTSATLTKSKFEEVMQKIKDTERDYLDKMPIEVVVGIESGYLIGYAKCWNKVRDALLKELE